MTWNLRLVTLDNIGLPFCLTSILISLSVQKWNKKSIVHKHIGLVLLSGTFLGLAMLTKIPFFTMIPLVGYLIYKNSNYLKAILPLKMIAIWLIPIIIIPSIVPLYAISVGEFDLWKEGVTTDAETRSQTGNIRVLPLHIFNPVIFRIGRIGIFICKERLDYRTMGCSFPDVCISSWMV